MKGIIMLIILANLISPQYYLFSEVNFKFKAGNRNFQIWLKKVLAASQHSHESFCTVCTVIANDASYGYLVAPKMNK